MAVISVPMNANAALIKTDTSSENGLSLRISAYLPLKKPKKRPLEPATEGMSQNKRNTYVETSTDACILNKSPCFHSRTGIQSPRDLVPARRDDNPRYDQTDNGNNLLRSVPCFPKPDGSLPTLIELNQNSISPNTRVPRS